VMGLFERAYRGDTSVSISEVTACALQLFERLKEELQGASPEKREELKAMLAAMREKLIAEAKAFRERKGLTEEQVKDSSDNPRNYSKEMWQELQESKRKLLAHSREITQVVNSKDDASKGKKSKKRKIKKSNWMQI
jgi:Na+/phosphate symporter